MKTKVLAIVFIVLCACTATEAWADGQFKIRDGKNCIVIREGVKFALTQVNILTESDTICFYRNSYLLLENRQTKQSRPFSKLYGSYCLRDLMQNSAKSDIARKAISAYFGHMFYNTKEAGPVSLVDKGFSAEDDSLHLALSIPRTIHAFFNDGNSFYSNFLQDSSVIVSFNDDKSVCTVSNNSPYDIFVDVLACKEDKFISVISSDREWISDLYVLKGEKISFLLDLQKMPGIKLLFAYSEAPLPFNEIMRLYRPLEAQTPSDKLKIRIGLKKM